MGCSTYLLALPQCPTSIVIPTALEATTPYHWELQDKFGNIYKGNNLTDANGTLSIPVSTFTNLPKGYFCSFSGAFLLTVGTLGAGDSVVPAQYLFGTAYYDAVELLFTKTITAT